MDLSHRVKKPCGSLLSGAIREIHGADALAEGVYVGEHVEPRLRLYAMRTLWIAGVLVLAACLAACSDDPPMSTEQPDAQGQVEETDPAQLQSKTQPQSQPRPKAPATGRQTSAQQPRSKPMQAEADEPAAQSAQSKANAVDEDNSADDPASAPDDLTDVPAVVVADADVRARPGLAWPIIERLSAGEETVVLNAAGSWYRIVFGDGRSGWMLAGALDLGAVEHRDILERQAPLIIAEWRNVEYGVMGQSADATEVRLYRTVDFQSEIVSAPKGEVALLAEDITLDDLPVLISDETVVFPGDDFRAGQGKILPRADEWIWLPWGWLLAHNEEFIWQWRPESDELELIRRPPGLARLSPDGRHLAVIEYEDYVGRDYRFVDLHIIPLDGSQAWSLRELMSRSANGSVAEQRLVYTPNHLLWSSNSRSVLLTHQLRHDALSIAAVFLHPSGDAKLLTFKGVPGCHVNPWRSWWPPIHLRNSEETIVAVGIYCDESAGHQAGYLVYDEDGVFDRLVPLPDADAELDRDLELLRSAQDGAELGHELEIHWSPGRQRGLVVDYTTQGFWLYEAETHKVRPVIQENGFFGILPDDARTVRWDVYWLRDSRVAVLARRGYDATLGRLVIDVDTAMGVSFERGSVANWSCSRSGSWRTDGKLFLSTFNAYVGWGLDDEGRWIDGLSVANDAFAQLVLSRLDGSLAGMLRMPSWKWSAPLHIGEWSPSGEWLAIGGHRQPGLCAFGS